MGDSSRRAIDHGARTHAAALAGNSTFSYAMGEVRLGPLAHHVGHALRRAQLAVFAGFSARLSQFELKPGEFGVLIVIDQNPGLRATDVCHALGFQKANFAPLVRGLAQRGLVRRRSSVRDRRTRTLQLTPAGKRLLTRALKVHEQYERMLSARLGAAATQRLIAQLSTLAQPG